MRRHTRPLILAGITAVLMTACGGSDFTYHKSPDNKAFVRIPNDWEMFERREMLIASGLSLSPATQEQNPWILGFDGGPEPSVERVLDLLEVPGHPVVLAQVKRLTFTQHEVVSIRALRNYFYNLDEASQMNFADLIDYEELVLPGGLRGMRVVFDVAPAGLGEVQAGSEVMRVSQSMIVDAATELLYLLLVRCESHCYRDNARTIDQIVDSWTVKER